jgi:hypothetical protein
VREHRLQRAHGRQLGDERRLQGGERGGILVRGHDDFARAEAVLEGVFGAARLAGGGPGPARSGAVAPAGQRAGADLRARPEGALEIHGIGPCWGGAEARRRAWAPRNQIALTWRRNKYKQPVSVSRHRRRLDIPEAGPRANRHKGGTDAENARKSAPEDKKIGAN